MEIHSRELKTFNRIRPVASKLTGLANLTMFILQGINSIESSSKLQLPVPPM